jgi:hypothetical protein
MTTKAPRHQDTKKIRKEKSSAITWNTEDTQMADRSGQVGWSFCCVKQENEVPCSCPAFGFLGVLVPWW